MARIGREHDGAAVGLDAHALKALRMPAEVMQADTGRDLLDSGMELHATREHPVNHARDVVGLERCVDLTMAHAAPRRVLHLEVLKVVARPCK